MAKTSVAMFETKEMLVKIQGWARDGLSETQIAENLGISFASFRRYKKISPTIATVLKNGKEVADREVENALYKNATGYEYEETTEERKFNPTTQQFEMVVTKIVHKKVLPQTPAQIFWLKNRKPTEWRDKRIIEDHLNVADDGFIAALKDDANATFENADEVVEQ